MMKHLTINPAVGTARSSVSQYPTSRLRYITYHIARNGMTELQTCHRLRQVSGYAYFETIPCHLNFWVVITASDKAPVNCSFILLYQAGWRAINLKGL